jgi:predicted metal-binding membrane protein
MMQAGTALEGLLWRNRLLVLSGVAVLVALAWAYPVYVAQGAGDMASGMAMAQLQLWTHADFGLTFLMWAVMMVAMMVPTAAPMILLFATVNRRSREQERPYLSTGVFLSGYVIVWSGFAALVTVAIWACTSIPCSPR